MIADVYFQGLHLGVRQYARYVDAITASGYASGYAPGMNQNRVCIGYESGMHRGTHQVITHSVKLGQGVLAHAYP